MELREIPMRPGQLFMDPKRMIEACDENTIGVVPTFGVTYTGNYEFPQPLHDALDKFQADTGIDIDMHIDAASGGFLAPFVAPDIVWDFRLPRVKSISASGHKFGLAPLGCGWVIWRDEEALPQELVFNVDYLGGQIGTFAINFSRPAGQVIAQYYEFLRLGREGYTKVQNASYQVAAYLADEIAKLGPYEFICTGRPDEGIPAVCFKLKDGEDPGYTLYDLSERLRLRGWQVPAFTLGGEATDIVVCLLYTSSAVVVTVSSAWLTLPPFSLLSNCLIGSCSRSWVGRLISFSCVIRSFVLLSWSFLKSIVGQSRYSFITPASHCINRFTRRESSRRCG